MKALRFENATFGYSLERNLIEDLSVTFGNPHEQGGHVIALMGASGSGKSTILKLLLGTLKLKKGKIATIPNTPVISYIPQEPVLFEHLSPLENARYFSRISYYRNSYDPKLFSRLVDGLGMTDLLQRSKSVLDLSGGQKQRLMLLRALSIKPDIILLDEATAALDSEIKFQFLNQLREIIIDQNLLAVYVTHHHLEAELIADEIVYLPSTKDGIIRQIYSSDIASFAQAPPVLDAFEVFGFPKPNIIRLKKMEGGKLSPSKNPSASNYVIRQNQIKVIDDSGLSFKIINKNTVHALVEIENGQKLLINNNISIKEGYLSILGPILRYDNKGKFMETVEVSKGQII